MIASDITTEYTRTETLQKDRAELARLNRELKEYYFGIDDTVRRQEILQAKMNIHDEMNRLMLSTMAADRTDTAALDGIFSLWEQNALLLCMAADKKSSRQEQSAVDSLAQALGLSVIRCGELPESLGDGQRELFCLTAQEAIANASAALSVCRNNKVDIILMDVMTELDHSGLDAAQEIKRQFPQIKIVIVTSMPEYSWLARAREIGVDSFWYKDGQKDSILDVMERTMAGERIYPDETPLIHIGNTTNHDFTERELDVLKELTTGDTNTEIAERLHVSVGTVKSHIQHLMEKTGFRTRTELVSEARGLGIVIKNRREEHR